MNTWFRRIWHLLNRSRRERELVRPVTVSDLSGMGWERPFHGIAMAIFMFGFIGLPPAGLFLGKFYAFSAAVERGWAWLAIVGVVATVVSIYYYLGVVRAMYVSPESFASHPREARRPATLRSRPRSLPRSPSRWGRSSQRAR